MAEIKSTMDLVMERTRNLTLSEEEKRSQAKVEFSARVKGLICRYEDGFLTEERFPEELDALRKEFGITDHAFVLEELGRKLELQKDNAGTLSLLKTVAGAGTSQVEALLANYNEKYKSAEAEARRRGLTVLERAGITGPAVIPDLSEDGDWAEEAKKLQRSFEEDVQRWASRI